jgi:hypothetical protein
LLRRVLLAVFLDVAVVTLALVAGSLALVTTLYVTLALYICPSLWRRLLYKGGSSVDAALDPLHINDKGPREPKVVDDELADFAGHKAVDSLEFLALAVSLVVGCYKRHESPVNKYALGTLTILAVLTQNRRNLRTPGRRAGREVHKREEALLEPAYLLYVDVDGALTLCLVFYAELLAQSGL